MAEATETGYLSIGEVLGLLLEDFPDITISKIRFLESQGLISPERTASGYRKFYDDDVQLLRVILTEQHQNYLPLRVIKDRLDSGEIDPTGEHLRPNGARQPSETEATEATEATDGWGGSAPAPDHVADRPTPGASLDALATTLDATDEDHTPAEIPTTTIRAHPANRGRAEPEPSAPSAHRPDPDPEPAAAQLLPGVLLDRRELCAMVGMTDDELTQLESFGIISARQGGSTPTYGDDAVSIAKPATEFLRLGVEARHLRGWRTAAEREASLFEQLVTPRFRQRNPESRAEALAQLRRLDALGASLRAAMTRQALRHHFEA